MTAQGPYAESWQRYRRWYFGSLTLFIGYLPTFALLSLLVPALLDQTPVLLVLFFLYGGSWMFASSVARRWRCPRCGELFFGSMWLPQWPMAFVSTCRDCGLPKYADRDPDHAASYEPPFVNSREKE
jgi:hypothetical protein